MGLSYWFVLRFTFRFRSDLVKNGMLLIEATLQIFSSLLLARAIDTDENDFLQEINLMKSIGFHKNIVNLLGASTHMKPLCLVLEYMPYGDLLHYVRKKRTHVSFHRTLIY